MAGKHSILAFRRDTEKRKGARFFKAVVREARCSSLAAKPKSLARNNKT
jgi:hypothetical protein